jgi:hypothetical protein
MQKDGNLVLYNDDVARNDYAGGSVVWTGTDTHRLGQISSLSPLQIDGVDQWTPADINVGRSGGFTWELKQSSPSAAGQTTTADKQFSDTAEWGTRTVTIRFSLESVALAAGNYSQNNSGYTGFGWNKITGYQIIAQSGFWRDQEDFIAKLDLTDNNPFKAGHPTDGTLQEVGQILKISSTGWLNAKQLRLKDDGVLVVEDSDGSDVTWSSSNDPITTEPKVEQVTNTAAVDADVCGKRISDCRKRFPSGDANGGLPFGSFPSVGVNN